jgi:hypothetical protein
MLLIITQLQVPDIGLDAVTEGPRGDEAGPHAAGGREQFGLRSYD